MHINICFMNDFRRVQHMLREQASAYIKAMQAQELCFMHAQHD